MPDGSRVATGDADWWGVSPGLFVGFFVLAILVWALTSKNRTSRVSWKNIRVDNTIVGWDRERDCLLVAAHTTWQIQGYNKHVPGNDPVGIHFFKQLDNHTNLYVVDRHQQFGTNHPDNPYCVQNTKFRWSEVPGGPWEFVPRGARENWSGFVADEMAGWSYNYIQPKGHHPDISAPGVSIKEEE